MAPPVPASVDLQQLKTQIQCWSGELGFDGIGISNTEISGADDMAIFRRKLAGQYDWMGPWQRRQARKP